MGKFRVCRTSGSGSWVRRLDLDLSSLDSALVVFPGVPCPGSKIEPGRLVRPKTVEGLPSSTSSLPQSRTFRPASAARSLPKEGSPGSGSSHEVFSPSAHRVGASTPGPQPPKRLLRPLAGARLTEVNRPSSRALPARFVPSSSFLTTSTGCSAIDRPEISPGFAHGVSSFRVVPDSRRARSFPSLPSPLDVPHRPLSPGLHPTRASTPSTSGFHSEGRPSPPSVGFPPAGARSPRGLSCGALFRVRPRLPKVVRTFRTPPPEGGGARPLAWSVP